MKAIVILSLFFLSNIIIIRVVEAVDLKMLRIGVSSIFDMATVAAKTLLEFS